MPKLKYTIVATLASQLLFSTAVGAHRIRTNSQLFRPEFERIIKNATGLMGAMACDTSIVGFTAYVETDGKLIAVCNKKHFWEFLGYPGWATAGGASYEDFIYRFQPRPDEKRRLEAYSTPANITPDNTNQFVELGENMYKVLMEIRKKWKATFDDSNTTIPYIYVHIDIDRKKLPKPDKDGCYNTSTELGTAVVTATKTDNEYGWSGPMGSFPNIKYRFCPAKEKLSW